MSISRSTISHPQTTPAIRAGGTMWTVKDWRGMVYPQSDPQRSWPRHYGSQFGTLEFNATHYRIHPADRMAEWASAMPEGFRFCPKFPQIITHFRRFNDCDGPTDDFIEGLLGPRRQPRPRIHPTSSPLCAEARRRHGDLPGKMAARTSSGGGVSASRVV